MNYQEHAMQGEDVFIPNVKQPKEYSQGYIPKAYLIPSREQRIPG